MITLHQEMLRQTRGEDNPFRVTLMLKKAMAMATANMDAEQQNGRDAGKAQSCPTTDQKLSVLVAYLRALHQGKTWRLGQMMEGVAAALELPSQSPPLRGLRWCNPSKARS